MPAVSTQRLTPCRLAGAIHAWMYALFLGLVVLDVICSEALQAGLDASTVDGIFIEISYFLLIPLALVILTGIVASLFGWRNRVVRVFVPLSLLLPLAALIAYAATGPAIEEPQLGGTLRIVSLLAASLLAMRAAIGAAAPDSPVGV